MQFESLTEALNVYREPMAAPRSRTEAQHYILRQNPEKSVPQLLDALLSDHFVVRWEAAQMLAQIGCPALKDILMALVDPKRVGDPRLRNGIYHILRANHDPFVREVTTHLLQTLHGSVSDLNTMIEASHLLQEVRDCP